MPPLTVELRHCWAVTGSVWLYSVQHCGRGSRRCAPKQSPIVQRLIVPRRLKPNVRHVNSMINYSTFPPIHFLVSLFPPQPTTTFHTARIARFGYDTYTLVGRLLHLYQTTFYVATFNLIKLISHKIFHCSHQCNKRHQLSHTILLILNCSKHWA